MIVFYEILFGILKLVKKTDTCLGRNIIPTWCGFINRILELTSKTMKMTCSKDAKDTMDRIFECNGLRLIAGASQHSKSMAYENCPSRAVRTSRALRSTAHCVFNYLQPVSTRKNLFSFSSFFFFLYSAVGEFFDIILLIML